MSLYRLSLVKAVDRVQLKPGKGFPFLPLPSLHLATPPTSQRPAVIARAPPTRGHLDEVTEGGGASNHRFSSKMIKLWHSTSEDVV